ncbi:UNVERIFIED_CONTAM: hypothetical protein Slati_0324800 [Sesamum latifolium]|uniref:DC1 domain-containing protein n=1 Tax=Sesamum latifolium TaxID=2727402 RepID=A0AAW2YES1_9LAMI
MLRLRARYPRLSLRLRQAQLHISPPRLLLRPPRQIRHRSHPKHPLGLSFSPPYNDGEFTCDACGRSGHAFTYHCGTCKFDLHVECAALPEVENRRDHEHPLVLLCGCPPEGGAAEFVCYVCCGCIGKGCWMYCCLGCNCGAHLECAGIPSH